MVGMLGFAALAIDVGRAMYTQRELQATTDAAALAAARAMPTAASTSAITGTGGVVAQYSSATGGLNVRSSLPSVTVSSTLECLNSLKAQGIPCTGKVPYNAVQVTQSLTLNTFFGAVIGKSTIAINAISTASTRGGSPRPSNVVVIMDTTLSMNFPDTNCVVNNAVQTEMQCALNGFQVLLQNLSPCGNYQTACASGTPNPFDQVSLFTFPNLTPGTASIDANCTTPIPNTSQYSYSGTTGITVPPNVTWPGVPTATTYATPTPGASSYSGSSESTYQVTGFLSDYRLSNATTALNSSSHLVKAAGAVTGCGSMLPSNYDGAFGTYYAGAIYAAQSALVEQQALYPTSENVIILLSDGNATAPAGTNFGETVISNANGSGVYPSYLGQCGQAIVAAQTATAAGTLVYAVAYGAEPTGCLSDVEAGSYPNISPCDTMASIASAPQYFYSDYQQSGSNSLCVSSQPVVALNDIFQAIAADLTEARLIPNTTQ